MKILYYSPHPHLQIDAPTGYGTHMREMIKAWRLMGIEVKTLIAGDLLFPEREESSLRQRDTGSKSFLKKLLPTLIWESLKDLRLMLYDFKLEKELGAMIDSFEPDFIYERVAYIQNSGIKVARKKGIKHIAEINAPYPEERVMFSGKSLFLETARNAEREVLVYSHGVSVVSSALKEHFEKCLPDSSLKIRVIPNAVNQSEVSHNRDAVNQLKEQYKLQGCCVIGFVGSIFPYHGVDILIEAFSKIPGEQLRMLVVGDGETLPELKSKARALGVLNRVIFTGSVPHREVYTFIELMDVCCMAKSNWYGSPVKIFEYGLMRKAVIAPDVVPVRDVMTDKDGVLVEPTVKSLQNAFKKLIDSPEFRDEIAANWHRKVISQYTWDVAAGNTLELCM
ncbi:MAG TPA: glycosyltransferase family 4 protein [Cryomorphaceae bacterium]|nr:glycosyltransferase family 4 protein [Cryomorphaceae bacterium]